MKYLDAFRDGDLARRLAAAIAAEANPQSSYRLMEFCGGHTHTLARYGLERMLPDNVTMIHGPGCPVCVLPTGRIELAIDLARRPDVIMCSYGDMLRVPGKGGATLMKARAAGADVRMIYSTQDALRIAQDHPEREVVFFAIGFETTTPPTAVAIKEAQRLSLNNFTVLCNHVLTPAAMAGILDTPAAEAVRVDGFVGPGHVSTVIGSRPFERFARDYGYPVVITGFEPLDILQAIRQLIRQLNDRRAELENEYSRVVSRDGNQKAQALMAEVFELCDAFEWRGLGSLPHSALKLRAAFADYDAEERFAIAQQTIPDHKACECAAVLRGAKRPEQCKVFATACTPDNPLGSCMVSSEGACAAHYRYGRFAEPATVQATH
ncbi:MAG: hydrogenase formation protein HypD [Gammaproteobacteria bacterium]